MLNHDKETITTIAQRLRAELGDRLETIQAFGSRARGDHGPWSDFDLLVVVRYRTPDDEHRIIDIIVDAEQAAGVSMSPVIKHASAPAREAALHTPLYENLDREAVRF